MKPAQDGTCDGWAWLTLTWLGTPEIPLPKPIPSLPHVPQENAQEKWGLFFLKKNLGSRTMVNFL